MAPYLTLSLLVAGLICLDNSPVRAQSLISDKNLTRSTNQNPKNDFHTLATIYSLEYSKDLFEAKIVEDSMDTRLARYIEAQSGSSVLDRDHHKFNFASPSVRKEYQAFISGPEVDQKQCTAHLQQMNSLLDEINAINSIQRNQGNSKEDSPKLKKEHIHLARVLESFGRYESGMLSGRSDLLGSPYQCLETRLLLGSDRVGTRMCVAKMKLSSGSTIGVNVCLPNTCHSNSLVVNQMLIQRLVDSQFKMPDSIYVNQHLKIDSLFCLNDNNETIGYPTSGKIFILVSCVWICLLAISTLYYETFQASQSRAVRSLSRCLNVKLLFLDFIEQDNNGRVERTFRVNLDSINGLRAGAMVMIVVGHSLLIHIFYISDYFRAAALFRNNSLATSAISANQLVDTFFIMSSMLFGYIALKRFKPIIEAGSTFTQLSRLSAQIMIFRYLRLVPIYFIVHWFKRSILLYSGSGPMWDHGFDQTSLYGGCKAETWLVPFTPLASYLPAPYQCLVQTWSLGAEIFFLFLTTPLLILIAKKPKLGVFISILVGLASLSMMSDALASIDPVDMQSIYRMSGNWLRVMYSKYSQFYTSAHLRLYTVMGGLVCGYLLHLYDKMEIKQWPNWFTNHATKLAFASVVGNVLGYYLVPYGVNYQPDTRLPGRLLSWLMVFNRLSWTFASCVILMRMMTDLQDHILIRSTSGRFLRVIGKTNLFTLLIHMDFLFVRHGYSRYSEVDHYMLPSIDTGVAIYLYCVIFGALVYVLVESPLDKVIQVLLGVSKEKVDLNNAREGAAKRKLA